MRKLLLASAAMVALGGPALAADAVPPPPVPAPPVVAAPAPTFDWTGPYVGFYAGYGFGYSAATGTTPGAFDEGVAGLTLPVDPRGVLGGVTVGYNQQAGAFVFGVEGTGGYLNLNGTNALTGGGDVNATLDDDTGTVNYGWYGTVAARLGVAMDRTLLFATAGGIVTQFSSVYGDLDGALDAADATVLGGPQFGYVLGGGAEFAFDTNWTAKLEYNYFNLGTDTTGNNTPGDAFSQRNSAHLVRFGLNYLFNY
ncbi:MAG: outer membrane protein [Bauldia sp.]